jgi:hypothetical protein
VAFTEAIDKTDYAGGTGVWPAGTTGTVISDYGDHKEVEIVDADRQRQSALCSRPQRISGNETAHSKPTAPPRWEFGLTGTTRQTS